MNQLKKEEKDKLEFKELLLVSLWMILKRLDMLLKKLKKLKFNKLKEKSKKENKKYFLQKKGY